jgi:hypothetical protein
MFFNAASRAAQQVATSDAGEPSTATTMPKRFTGVDMAFLPSAPATLHSGKVIGQETLVLNRMNTSSLRAASDSQWCAGGCFPLRIDEAASTNRRSHLKRSLFSQTQTEIPSFLCFHICDALDPHTDGIVNAKKKGSASNAHSSLAGQTDRRHHGWRCPGY